MDELVQYIKIKPEYRSEFIKGVASYFQHSFDEIKAINHKIIRLAGIEYNYDQEKGIGRTVSASGSYACFLMGEISEKTLSEKCIRELLDDGQTLQGKLKAKLLMALKGSEIAKSGLSEKTIKLEVKALRAGMRIAEREGIPLEAVFRSENFNREVDRAVYRTIEDKRKEFLSVLNEKLTWFPIEEMDIKKWAVSDLIDPKEIINLKENLRYFPRSAKFRAYKIAVIIANEEDLVRIYGDSVNQKLKREKLYEVMEYFKLKA